MTRRCSLAAASLVGALAAFAGSAAEAHQIQPSVLALREVSPGRFLVHWSPPSDGSRRLTEIQPRFPEHCRAQGDSNAIVDCGARGLVGAIRFEGGPTQPGVSVDIEWLDGPRELRVATGDPAVLAVSGAPRAAPLGQRFEMARTYAAMGVEHILTGVDHLMFVSGLLLFARSVRRLLLTITSFTLAHSVTLAAATFGVVHPPRGPVEFCIALSILLLAVEASRKESTWTHRAPWLVAFAFGLLHGFGFASALREVGLPPQHVPLALASFNAGVEAGQIVAVAVVIAAVIVARRFLLRETRAVERARAVSVFALGAASVYWCIDRAPGVWSALQN